MIKRKLGLCVRLLAVVFGLVGIAQANAMDEPETQDGDSLALDDVRTQNIAMNNAVNLQKALGVATWRSKSWRTVLV